MADLSRLDTGILQVQDGKPIQRDRRCVCGKEFSQFILSEKFLASMERQNRIAALAKQIPGFWVPKYCPPCERKDLALEERRVEIGTQRTGTW